MKLIITKEMRLSLNAEFVAENENVLILYSDDIKQFKSYTNVSIYKNITNKDLFSFMYVIVIKKQENEVQK